jgi:hypothetical protein
MQTNLKNSEPETKPERVKDSIWYMGCRWKTIVKDLLLKQQDVHNNLLY